MALDLKVKLTVILHFLTCFVLFQHPSVMFARASHSNSNQFQALQNKLNPTALEETKRNLLQKNSWIVSTGRMSVRDVEDYLNQAVEHFNEVSSLPFYKEAFLRKPEPISFTITSYEQKPVEKLSYGRLNSGSDQTLKSEDVVVSLRTLLLSFEKCNRSSLFSSLATAFPEIVRPILKSKKKEEEKLHEIVASLKQTDIDQMRKRFRADALQLPKEWQPEDLLKKYFEINSRLNSIYHHMALLLITSLEKENISHFESKDHLLSLIEATVENAFPDINWDSLYSGLSEYIAANFSKVASHEWVKSHSLFVRELTPEESYFRGNVTFNCATTSSAAYSFSPSMRDFLVQDERGTLMHFSGTRFTTNTDNHQPFFLWHDLAGASVTSLNAQLLIQGVIENAEKLGFDPILFADKELRHSIGWGYNPEKLTGSPVDLELTAEEGEIRQTISSLVSRNGYDGVFRRTGLTPKKESYTFYPKVEVILNSSQSSESPNREVEPNDQTSPRHGEINNPAHWLDIISTSLNLENFEHADPSVASTLKELIPILRNNEKLQLANYYERVAPILEGLGVTISHKFFNDHWPIFEMGHDNAPDGYKYQPNANTHKKIYTMISEWIFSKPEKAAQILRSTGAGWLREARIKNRMNQLFLSPIENNIQRTQHYRNNGISPIEFLLGQENGRDQIMRSEFADLKKELLLWEIENFRFENWQPEDWRNASFVLENRDERITEDLGINYVTGLLELVEIPKLPEIRHELRVTVRDEENTVLRSLAAIAYFRLVKNENLENLTKKELKALDEVIAILEDPSLPQYIYAVYSQTPDFAAHYRRIKDSTEIQNLNENTCKKNFILPR